MCCMQWRSQDFSEGEAIVTTQFFEIWVSETAYPAF